MKKSQRQCGSTLIAAVGIVAILAVLSGTVLTNVMNRRATINQSALWQEALMAAEAGAHQGAAQLSQGLAQNSIPTNGQSFTVALPHAGETSTSSSVTYTLTQTLKTIGSMSRPYYTVVATGTVGIPDGQRLGMDYRDIVLRKLNLSGTTKTATRKIEVVYKPIYNTDSALAVDGALTLNNHNIFVDSFDSSSLTRSIAGNPGTVGQFNVAPYNTMLANVSTNGSFAGVGNATIYGDLATGPNGTASATTNVQGLVRDDYDQDFAPVYPPYTSSTSGVTSINPKITKTYTFTGGTAASPAKYIVNSITLAGAGEQIIFAAGNTGSAPDPTKKYVEVYVIADFNTKGGGNTTTGAVYISPGVEVKVYVGGNMDVTGNGIVNGNTSALNLSVYGVNAPTATATVGQTFTFAGSSTFYGMVYAPGAALKLAGGGNGTFVGSLTGASAEMNGNVEIRYDEALSSKGLITRFALAGWFEDTKSNGSFTGAL